MLITINNQNYKSGPQWDTTSYPFDWQKSKFDTIIYWRESASTGSYTLPEGMHFGKQLDVSPKVILYDTTVLRWYLR